MRKKLFDTLPKDVQGAFLERIFTPNLTSQDHVLWLAQHNIESSNSGVHRNSQAIRKQYGALIELGMPVKDLIQNRHTLDAVGIERVKQKLLDKAEKVIDSLIESISDSATSTEPNP